jgi:hypothetical protein
MLSADGDGTSVANAQNFGHFPWFPQVETNSTMGKAP